MILKKLPYLLLLVMSIFLFSCESEEEDFNSNNNTSSNTNNSNTSSNWSTNYWKKNNGDVYLDLKSGTPKICSNGQPLAGTYSPLRWESANIAFFTLYNAGDEVEFRIEKNGASLILAPWDAVAQQTHSPATYSSSNIFPCNDGGGSNDDTSSDTGKIAFYTRQNNGCAAVSITVNGTITQSLQYYYPDGISNCTQGEVFNLPAGNHSFSAQCGSYTWSGNFQITAGGCLIFDLR